MPTKTSKTSADEAEQKTVETAEPVRQDSDVVVHQTTARKPLMVFSILVLLALVLFGGIGYGVAYANVKLGNPGLEKQISNTIQSLPFTPKTPKYLLEQSAIVQQKALSYDFDMSSSIKINDSTIPLGLNQIDISAKGAVDMKDLKNVKLNLNTSITKDFNADVRITDNKLYFKINKVPNVLLAMANINQSQVDRLIANWVNYDITPLETEARKELDKAMQQQKSLTPEQVQKMIENVYDETVMRAITVTEEKVDNYQAYKIHFAPNNEQLDHFVKNYLKELERLYPDTFKDAAMDIDDAEISKVLKNLVMDMWIEKGTYYSKKVMVSMTVEPDGANPPSARSRASASPEMSVVVVVKSDNFGKAVTVEVPANSIPLEQFILQMQNTFGVLGAFTQNSGLPGTETPVVPSTEGMGLPPSLESYEGYNYQY